jgi:outer membrane protein
MDRRLLIVTTALALLAGLVSAGMAAELKFAYLDAQKILDQTKAGQQAKKTMEEYRDSRQKIIDLDESEIKRLQDDLARQASVLEPEARRSKEEMLQKKLFEYQQKVGELTKELDSKKRDILTEFNNGLIEAVKKIAQREGYKFVFDRNAEGGVLLYAEDQYDITDKVIKEYDAATP